VQYLFASFWVKGGMIQNLNERSFLHAQGANIRKHYGINTYNIKNPIYLPPVSTYHFLVKSLLK
jgi:hypothetical protein